MDQFDILSRETDVLTHRLLEASAGTGKTFAIEHLVVRLILCGVDIEKILLVTFTRAATRELKMRVRNACESACFSLKNRRSSLDYLSAIIEEDDLSVQQALRRLHDALSVFDRAQIFTIHGFCFRMLQEYAFEAGVSFAISDPTEGEHLKKSHQIICDFFRTRCKQPHYSLSQIESVLQHHQGDLDRLIARLEKCIDRRVLFSDYPSFEQALVWFNESLKKAPVWENEKLLQDFYLLIPHYKGVDVKLAERQLSTFLGFLEKRECSPSAFDELMREETWFLEPLHPQNLKKRTRLPDSSQFFYPGVFAELRARFVPIVQSAKDPLHTFIRMARDCRREVEKDSTLSFDELLHKMKEALKSIEFCSQIRERYDALIVDEFQDTDPLQWEIFQTIFLQHSCLRCLYLVGDPKQSIYGFRGADVYTYLKAASLIKERAYLMTNFRSVAPLVQALNYFFSQGGGENWLQLPKQKSTLAYRDVKSVEKTRNFDGDALHFFIAQGEKGREKGWPTKMIENERFFPFIAEEMQMLVNKNQCSFHQIAVLVKDRYQGERLQRFLKKCEIPSRTSRGKNILYSKGYQALLQFLQALLDPSQIQLLLAGPLFGLSHEEMKNEDLSLAKNHILNLTKSWKSQGFGAIVEDFFTFCWKGESVLQRASKTERLCEEFRRAAELLMKREAEGPTSLEAHLLFLQYLKKRMKYHEEELTYYPTESEDAVSILTVHMSKGLEFDVVFALGVASRQTQQERLIFVREETAERLEKLDQEDPATILYLKEQNAEKMRQLYVALTRAKQKAYVPLALEKGASIDNFSPIELFLSKQTAEELSIETLLSFLQEAKTHVSIGYTLLQERSSSPKWICRKSVSKIESESPRMLAKDLRTVGSFSSLIKKEMLVQEEESHEIVTMCAQEPMCKNAYTLPSGVETGIFLHAILEKIFKKGLFIPRFHEKRRELIFQELYSTSLRGWEEIVVDMINNVLALPIVSDFCLERLAVGQFVQEMEFLFPIGQKLMKGFVDLLFEHKGKYYLVDWKSNGLGLNAQAYNLENLERAMRMHHYFLQGAIYASAFERYVKLFDKRPFKELFGGAFYLFLRGSVAYHFIPDRDLVQEACP